MVNGSLYWASLALLLPVFGFWSDSWSSIREAAGRVETLQSPFRQAKHHPILEQPLVSEGRFSYRKPGQLRWEYTKPVRSLLISNRGRVHRYTWRKGRWVADATGRLEPLRAVLSEMDGWMRGEFTGSKVFRTELQQGRPVRVVLTPREAALKEYVRRVTLELSTRPGVVERIVIDEGEGAKTEIVLEQPVVNKPISDDRFAVPR